MFVTAGSEECQQEPGVQLVVPETERDASPSNLGRPTSSLGLAVGPQKTPGFKLGCKKKKGR